jgi:hydroxyacyl-ACP dehydratase HTD2-like protein with hotdog domain
MGGARFDAGSADFVSTPLELVQFAAVRWEFERIHFDDAWARREGLPGPILNGPVVANYVYRFLCARGLVAERLHSLEWRNVGLAQVGEVYRVSGTVECLEVVDSIVTGNVFFTVRHASSDTASGRAEIAVGQARTSFAAAALGRARKLEDRTDPVTRHTAAASSGRTDDLVGGELRGLIGQPAWPPRSVLVRESDILRYNEATRCPPSFGEDGSLIAPPMFIPPFAVGGSIGEDGRRTAPAETAIRPPGMARRLFGSCSIEFEDPIRPGEVITARSRITDVTGRRARSGPIVLSTTETQYTDDSGRAKRSERIVLVHR